MEKTLNLIYLKKILQGETRKKSRKIFRHTRSDDGRYEP